MTLDEVLTAAGHGCRFTVDGWPGVAARVVSEQEQATPDSWWDGVMEPTGMVIVVMVGDDARHVVDPADLTALGDLDYCHVCGQVGCGHDGLDRSETGQEDAAGATACPEGPTRQEAS